MTTINELTTNYPRLLSPGTNRELHKHGDKRWELIACCALADVRDSYVAKNVQELGITPERLVLERYGDLALDAEILNDRTVPLPISINSLSYFRPVGGVESEAARSVARTYSQLKRNPHTHEISTLYAVVRVAQDMRLCPAAIGRINNPSHPIFQTKRDVFDFVNGVLFGVGAERTLCRCDLCTALPARPAPGAKRLSIEVSGNLAFGWRQIGALEREAAVEFTLSGEEGGDTAPSPLLLLSHTLREELRARFLELLILWEQIKVTAENAVLLFYTGNYAEEDALMGAISPILAKVTLLEAAFVTAAGFHFEVIWERFLEYFIPTGWDFTHMLPGGCLATILCQPASSAR